MTGRKPHLDHLAVSLLLACTLFWGFQQILIKSVVGEVPPRFLSRLDPDSREFADGFTAFLYEYGSRGPNEWESRSPSWETRPALALAAIDRMRGAPDSSDPAASHADRATSSTP